MIMKPTKRFCFHLFVFCSVICFVNAKTKLSETREPSVIKEQGDSLTKNPVGSIIDAPVLACPEGQKRDWKGKCRKEF